MGSPLAVTHGGHSFAHDLGTDGSRKAKANAGATLAKRRAGAA
jgi:hypothetical protein